MCADVLFSQISRANLGPSGYAEPKFRYLDLSARPMAQLVRDTLEEWFSHYPNEERAAFKSRFCSENDNDFMSSFFELYLHELLLRTGHEIKLHPNLPSGKSRHPDFLAMNRKSGTSLYIEAVLANELSREGLISQANVNLIYDSINGVDSPDYWLSVKVTGTTKMQRPIGRIKKGLAEWLAALDYDAIVATYEPHSPPRWEFALDGWKIEFSAFPKNEARGQEGLRPLGIVYDDFGLVRVKDAIRSAVLKKAGRYGELDKPYLIAVNLVSSFGDREDEIDALFGTVTYLIPRDRDLPEDFIPQPTRIPDGVWRTRSGPRYTRVSGVMIWPSLQPWSIASCDLTQYHNPWAQRPIEGTITQLTNVRVINGQLEVSVGVKPRQLFGLPEGWPEQWSTTRD